MKEEEKLPEYRWTMFWTIASEPALLHMKMSANDPMLVLFKCLGALHWLRCSQGSDPSTVLSLAELLMACYCCSGVVTSPFLTAQGWLDAWFNLKQPLTAFWWHIHSRFLLSDLFRHTTFGQVWRKTNEAMEVLQDGAKIMKVTGSVAGGCGQMQSGVCFGDHCKPKLTEARNSANMTVCLVLCWMHNED